MAGICFGAMKGFTAPKNHVYLPSHMSPANNMGFYKTSGHREELGLEFQSSLQSPFRNLPAVYECQQTLTKFHLCINLQNRKNAS